MNIIPKPGPTLTGSNSIPTPSTQAVQARERAIAKLMGSPQPEVQNQNQVQPEELQVVKEVDSQQIEKLEETELQAQPEKEEPKRLDEKLSNQYAVLAKKEKALRIKAQQQEQQFKAKEEALKQREEQLTQKDTQYNQGYFSKDSVKQNPLQVLEDAGVTYEELTQQILNQQAENPRVNATIAKLEAKIKQLEDKTQASEKSYEEKQQQSYQQAINQIRRDVVNLVTQDSQFETIRNTGKSSVDEVVKLIELTYKEDGVIMDIEDAASQVEQELEKRLFNVFDKTEKFKKRYASSTSKQTQAESQAQTPAPTKQIPTIKTLTNASSGSRQLTARDRAILAFKGELGKG